MGQMTAMALFKFRPEMPCDHLFLHLHQSYPPSLCLLTTSHFLEDILRGRKLCCESLRSHSEPIGPSAGV